MEHRRPTITADDARQNYGYLTTIGRKSGNPHEIEIWFGAVPGSHTLFLMSGGRERADWVKNLLAHPTVHFRIRGVTYTGTTRLIEGTPEERTARELLAAKHYGWVSGEFPNDWCRNSLPFAIDLDDIAEGQAA